MEHFDRKSVEKDLFATYMPCAADKRRTRTLLRKTARHVEHGYEIGVRDRQAGKPMVSFKELQDAQGTGVSPFKQDIIKRAYAAYQLGYLEEGELSGRF